MGRWLILGIVAAVLAGTSARAEWREYTYPEFGFAIHFPDKPKVADGTYSTGTAMPVKARIYSLEAPDSLYRVTVADFFRTGIGEDAVIEAAVKELSALGEVTIDERARVNQVYGRRRRGRAPHLGRALLLPRPPLPHRRCGASGERRFLDQRRSLPAVAALHEFRRAYPEFRGTFRFQSPLSLPKPPFPVALR